MGYSPGKFGKEAFVLLGVDYYPEHWPQKRWETDARLMREAGITRVSVGEFAWHRMEPTEGAFDFEWFREAVDLLGRHGIKTIMGTPTPAYPPWLHRKHPDLHQVNSAGRVKEFGQRQDVCKNHPGYRQHARLVVERLAGALGNHPDIVAWQIDNEFGCHDTARCYCPRCEALFQEWLRERFGGDIAALNRAWGTFFWSQDYNDFSEICVPRDTADNTGNDGQSPALVLDFYRFSSDVQVRFQREQAEVLRRLSPGRTITHNFMGLFPHIDYFALAADLDVVSWDNYPFWTNGTNRPPRPLAHDLMRGLKRRNVWVMEQGSGPGGWGTFPSTPQPGQMRAWAYQAVARGADLVSFFRWRSCRWGREQYWHGILYHHGQPQRRYAELKQLGAEFKKLSGELDGTSVRSEVAILHDYDTVWALETQPHVRSDRSFDPREMAQNWGDALARLGVTADAVSTAAGLEGYKLVIAPTLHVCTPELAARLEAFVRAGGTLVLGPRSGAKDLENAVVDELLPGPLRRLAGCHVEEYDVFAAVQNLAMTVRGLGGRHRARALAEVLVPEGGAKALLTYGAHYYAGRPAAVRNVLGKGRCVYLGTVLEAKGLAAVLRPLLRETGVASLAGLPASVEFTRRCAPGRSLAFYLNHGAKPVKVRLAKPGKDLLTGRAVKGQARIPGFEVLIVREQA
jgi:beta-galactosidase